MVTDVHPFQVSQVRLSEENHAVRVAAVSSGMLSKDHPMWAANRRLPGLAAKFTGVISVLESALELASRTLELEWGENRPVLPRFRVPVVPCHLPEKPTVDDGSFTGECGLQRTYLDVILAPYPFQSGCKLKVARTVPKPVAKPVSTMQVVGDLDPGAASARSDMDAENLSDATLLETLDVVSSLFGLGDSVEMSQPQATATSLNISELQQIDSPALVKAG
jgi:hypothetical protein